VTGKHLRELHEAQPFVPFQILLANGDVVSVPHPDTLFISETGRIVTVFRGEESYRFIDLLLVIALEVPLTPGFDFSQP